MGAYGSPDLVQIDSTASNEKTNKQTNPFKILLFVCLCIPVAFISIIMILSIIKTGMEMFKDESFLSSDEQKIIQYIRNKSEQLGISSEEYIELIEKYELEK